MYIGITPPRLRRKLSDGFLEETGLEFSQLAARKDGKIVYYAPCGNNQERGSHILLGFSPKAGGNQWYYCALEGRRHTKFAITTASLFSRIYLEESTEELKKSLRAAARAIYFSQTRR